MTRKLVANRAQCLNCMDVIESIHRYDYVTCGCGNLSVDGGLLYERRLCKDENYFELSMYVGED